MLNTNIEYIVYKLYQFKILIVGVDEGNKFHIRL